MKRLPTILLVLTCLLCDLSRAENPEERAEECRKAGGKPEGYSCRCPNGVPIFPREQRCPNKPFTPEELRKQCDEYADKENRLLPEQLHLFAKQNNATSAAELFTKMKEDRTWQPFLKDYVLQANSQSAEEEAVDPEHPRRIKFHRGLVVASTAHPGHKGLNNFVQIFAADPVKGWVPATLTFEKGEIKYDGAPATCTRCHGTPPRPNWAGYRIWPGALTHRSDYFVKTTVKKLTDADIAEEKRKIELLGRAGQPLSRREQAEWFENARIVRTRRAVTPEYAVLDEQSRFGEDASGFNSFLNQWNFKIIAGRLRAAKDYDKLQYALLATILDCDGIPEFLGDENGEYRAAHEKRLGHTFADVQKEVNETASARMKSKLSTARSFGQTDIGEASQNDGIDRKRAAGLRYLFEGQGVNVKNFSLDYDPGRKTHGYEFNQFGGAGGGLRALACHFMADVIETDQPNLKTVGANAAVAGYGNDEKAHVTLACDALKAKSLEMITGKPNPVSPAAPAPKDTSSDKPTHGE